MRIVAALLGILLGWAQAADGAVPLSFMVELNLDSRKIEGTPISWDAREVHLLGRDGRLWNFAPDEATEFEKIGERFRCYSPSKIRAILLRELGDQYEVTGTSHYMVAHPRGQRDKWAQRFENLYRSFVHFFSVRGFKIQQPPFPLIGIVCRDQNQFFRYSASQGGPMSPGVLGYYSLGSNRITLYDQEAGRHDATDWHETATMLIHEATHQTAFNTGIHSRFSPRHSGSPKDWPPTSKRRAFTIHGIISDAPTGSTGGDSASSASWSVLATSPNFSNRLWLPINSSAPTRLPPMPRHGP